MSLKVFLVLALATCVLAQPKEDEDTFCEEDNCYEVMRLQPGASSKEVRKSYRLLSKELHPDNANGSEEKFAQLARAYGVLKSGDRKKQYDSFLYSPSRFPYMARFRKKRGPSAKIGVVQLLIGTALFIALVQFVIATSSRTAEIARISKVPDARKEYKKKAEDAKMLKGKRKDQIEKILKDLIGKDIKEVGIGDTILVQCLGWPSAVMGFVRFSILGQEPSEAEKIAIISVYLGIEADQWATEVTVEDQKVYLEGDMYKKENFFGGGSGVAKVGTGRYKREKRQAKKAARNPMQMRDD